MNATLGYEDAVEKYLAAIKETRSLPSQPSESLSIRRGKEWQLRNTLGLLATVSDNGEVSLGGEGGSQVNGPHLRSSKQAAQ